MDKRVRAGVVAIGVSIPVETIGDRKEDWSTGWGEGGVAHLTQQEGNLNIRCRYDRLYRR